MLPAWVPRLKDLKAMNSKQKQNKPPVFLNVPFSLGVEKSVDTDAFMCFMKALNLPRDTTKACCMPFEGSLGYFSSSSDTVSILSSSDIDANMCMQLPVRTFSADADYAATAELCSYGSDELRNGAEVPLHRMDCKGCACNLHVMSSCGTEVDPHLYEGKKRMVSCAQNDIYGVVENDTESSNVLTPNTIESSFGSESSSANSSVVRKCGYSEDRRQRLMLWQEGDCPKSPEGGLAESVYPEEAPFFTYWQDISSSEDLQSACNGEMQDISRLSYCESAPNSSKLLESSFQNLRNARRLGMETMSRLTYNGGELKQQRRSSHSVAGNASSSSFQGCHTRVHDNKVLPGCAFTMWGEGSQSFAKSSITPMSMQEKTVKSCPSNNVGSMEKVLQKESRITAGKSIKEGCEASDPPSFCTERSSFEDSMLCSLSCSEWEETSALIAVENPGLMLSSKWHKSSCEWQNPTSGMSAGANQMCVGQDNQNGMSTCAPQDDTIGLSLCPQQCNMDSLTVCSQQDDGNTGCHKSLHDAYLRRGRRCRGSSFSAVLPEDLQGVVGDSMALVKMSHNPYEDFRHSMYEMIMEKDLEEAVDVEELLYCYLSLNSPEHHELIEEVFSDVWSSILMSVR